MLTQNAPTAIEWKIEKWYKHMEYGLIYLSLAFEKI